MNMSNTSDNRFYREADPGISTEGSVALERLVTAFRASIFKIAQKLAKDRGAAEVEAQDIRASKAHFLSSLMEAE